MGNLTNNGRTPKNIFELPTVLLFIIFSYQTPSSLTFILPLVSKEFGKALHAFPIWKKLTKEKYNIKHGNFFQYPQVPTKKHYWQIYLSEKVLILNGKLNPQQLRSSLLPNSTKGLVITKNCTPGMAVRAAQTLRTDTYGKYFYPYSWVYICPDVSKELAVATVLSLPESTLLYLDPDMPHDIFIAAARELYNGFLLLDSRSQLKTREEAVDALHWNPSLLLTEMPLQEAQAIVSQLLRVGLTTRIYLLDSNICERDVNLISTAHANSIKSYLRCTVHTISFHTNSKYELSNLKKNHQHALYALEAREIIKDTMIEYKIPEETKKDEVMINEKITGWFQQITAMGVEAQSDLQSCYQRLDVDSHKTMIKLCNDAAAKNQTTLDDLLSIYYEHIMEIFLRGSPRMLPKGLLP